MMTAVCLRRFRTVNDKRKHKASLAAPAILFVILFIGLLTSLGIGTRYALNGGLNIFHALLCLYFSTNLLICYWEFCLLVHSERITQRTDFWQNWSHETGRNPAIEFFFKPVPVKQLISTAFWADVWATYSQYDDSYADKRTFGYSADVGNGFVTPIPTLTLFAAFTVEFLPSVLPGILGVMMFWQWVYVTGLYWVSFFLGKRHSDIGRLQLYLHIFLLNSFWVLNSLLGLYISIRLILDGNYSVLGLP